MGSEAQLISWTHSRIYKAINPKIRSACSFQEPIYNAPAASNDECLKATETRYGKSSIPLDDFAFEDARVVRAINALADLPRKWLRHRHLEGVANWDSIAAITTWVYEKTLNGLRESGRVLRKKSLKKLEGLCLLIVQAYRCGVRKRYSANELAVLFGVHLSALERDWGEPLRLIKTHLNQLDRESIDLFWQEIEEKKLAI